MSTGSSLPADYALRFPPCAECADAISSDHNLQQVRRAAELYSFALAPYRDLLDTHASTIPIRICASCAAKALPVQPPINAFQRERFQDVLNRLPSADHTKLRTHFRDEFFISFPAMRQSPATIAALSRMPSSVPSSPCRPLSESSFSLASIATDEDIAAATPGVYSASPLAAIHPSASYAALSSSPLVTTRPPTPESPPSSGAQPAATIESPPKNDPIHIVIGVIEGDDFTIHLEESDVLHERDVWHLIHDSVNAPLFVDPELFQRSEEPSAARTVDVGEFLVQQLHLIVQLHCQQCDGNLPRDLHISLVPRESLCKAMTAILAGDEPRPRPAKAGRWAPLSFSCVDVAAANMPVYERRELRPTSHSISIRFCELDDAIAGTPIRMVYAASLMWFSDCNGGSCDRITSAYPRLLKWLHQRQRAVGPPPVWFPDPACEAVSERKDLIYKIFKKHMLPTRWFTTSESKAGSVDQQLGSIALAMVDQQPAGSYVIKGAWASGGVAVSKVTIAPDANQQSACVGLLDELKKQVRNPYPQDTFGIQRFVKDFDRSELRTICVLREAQDALPRPAHFDDVSMVRTATFNLKAHPSAPTSSSSKPVSQVIKAEAAAAEAADALAVRNLVRSMLQDPEYEHFFSSLITAGVVLLRVDCGYDFDEKKAFFSEFAQYPDASLMTQVNGYDHIFYAARKFTTRLVKALNRSLAESDAQHMQR